MGNPLVDDQIREMIRKLEIWEEECWIAVESLPGDWSYFVRKGEQYAAAIDALEKALDARPDCQCCRHDLS